ncbi:MAG: YggS family pyridoxal phosphate-dependent enzyme [Bacteroidales bacterium]
MSIKGNLEEIRKTIPENVCLVAVSKTKPIENLEEAYDAGQRIFGENKAQEMAQKAQSLPSDIEWHFIGHLQTNKVKYIAPYVSIIEAVDSFKLMEKINKEAAKNNRCIDVLIQFYIAEEESKFGCDYKEAIELIQQIRENNLSNIRIRGVMGMATNTDNQEQVLSEFKQLKTYFHKVKESYFESESSFDTISMGMSNDYQLAIEAGSTNVRIGSSIFGARNYSK